MRTVLLDLHPVVPESCKSWLEIMVGNQFTAFSKGCRKLSKMRQIKNEGQVMSKKEK
jgi:hypothetical protein